MEHLNESENGESVSSVESTEEPGYGAHGVGEFSLTRSLSAALAPARSKGVDRPEIGHLDDAIVSDPLTGLPVLRVRPGDRIVIERRAYVLRESPAPWVDTRLWWVNDVDVDRGVLKLFDEALMQHGTDSFVAGLRAGQVYKLPPDDGRPWDAPPPKVKRAPAPSPQVNEHGTPIKKKRGRPPGVKNRSREEIDAERAEKRALAAARHARRA